MHVCGGFRLHCKVAFKRIGRLLQGPFPLARESRCRLPTSTSEGCRGSPRRRAYELASTLSLLSYVPTAPMVVPSQSTLAEVCYTAQKMLWLNKV